MDIDGNEQADKAAKGAAKPDNQERINATLKSARNAANRTQLKNK